MVEVFLSSTAKELATCRESAYRAIEGLEGYHCVRMEDFGARDEPPDELCRRRVATCDLFVILVGISYGSVGPTGISYTEMEYETALAAGRPCLVFLTMSELPIPAVVAEPDALQRKQQEFRERLHGSERTTASFRDCSELSTGVVQAIRNWEATPLEHSVIRVRRDGDGQARDYRRPFLRFGRNPEIEVAIVGDPEVSWEHGMVFKHAGRFSYRHLSRTNRTWLTVDGRSVMLRPGERREVVLGAHTELRMGSTTLRVEIALPLARQPYVPTDPQDA